MSGIGKIKIYNIGDLKLKNVNDIDEGIELLKGVRYKLKGGK